MGILQARKLEWVVTLPGDLPNPGIESRSTALQVGSLPSEPPGKPKNTGMGSLSLVQGIFLTEESNLGLLNCRQILYKQSHQGSPKVLGIHIYKMFSTSFFFFAGSHNIELIRISVLLGQKPVAVNRAQAVVVSITTN